METLQKTPLYDCHKNLNAKIVDFSGWALPVQYTSALDEHLAVRNSCGIFDISHMGEFTLKGKDSKFFLEKIIPTSLSKLENNKGMYTMLCNEQGGVIDDLFIFQKSEQDYYLVVNASRRNADFEWLLKHTLNMEVELVDVSDNTSKIDLQGPKSQNVLEKAFPSFIVPERFFFGYCDFEDYRVMISNTGYTGEVGFEIYCDNNVAAKIWNTLLEKGKEENILPCGLASRDSLRLEACYSLYGHELSETINPIEAGLGWVINSDKDYVASSTLKDIKANGAQRKIFCIKLIDKGIPREGYRIQCMDTDIGYVTSGCFSPLLKEGIAFVLLDIEKAKKDLSIDIKIGQELNVIIREKPIKACIVKRPFYTYNQG